MIRVLLVMLPLFVFFTNNVSAQNKAVISVLEDVYPAETSKELETALKSTTHAASAYNFWIEALTISRTELLDEPAGRIAITRLMEAALILGSVPGDSNTLDRLSNEDVSAMKAFTGFPGEDELLHYLFVRGPSVRDDFEFQNYAIVRLSPDFVPNHILRERASEGYLGLSEQFSQREIKPADDPVFKAPGEQAKTRTLNLAALPQIVLAAKAFRAAQRAPAEDRHLPLLIAAAAINRAVVADATDFRPVVYASEWLAINALKEAKPNNSLLQNELLRLERRIPRTAFFARLFSTASDAYRNAKFPAGDSHGKIWSAWGQAISIFASGGDSGPLFRSVYDMLTPEHARFVWMFNNLIKSLSDNERTRLGFNNDIDAALAELLAIRPVVTDDKSWKILNQDFLRIIETIGRPDIAVRYLVTEAEQITDDPDRQWRRDQILRWLGPFAHDLCYLISFEMSGSRSWKLRATNGYDPMADFLDNVHPDGELVQAGEVIVPLEGERPYSSVNPEEDCATVFVAYGVKIYTANGLVEEVTPDEEKANIVLPFQTWVDNAQQRDNASIRPYLKLIWLEWFGQSFVPMKNTSIGHNEFIYRPVNASELVTREKIYLLISHPTSGQHEKNLIEVFLLLHSHLEASYGKEN